MTLDDIKEIKKIDTGEVAESIQSLPEQIQDVLSNIDKVKINKDYSDITQIVVNGMGGSNLGSGIIKSVFLDQLNVPLSIVPGYQLPSSVNDKTLLIISSYSGTTEEPLSVYKEARKKGAKIMVVTSDDKKSVLKKLLKEDSLDGCVFNPNKNPSNQPRMGIGYSVFSIIILLSKAGLLKINSKEIEKIIKDLKDNDRQLRPSAKLKENKAKKIAYDLLGKTPVVVGAEFLIGNTRALRNQFCENSKNFASYLTIPELNHYALEGLGHPNTNQDYLSFLFFESKLYHSRVQKRLKLTKQIIKKNKIETISHQLTGTTKLEQAMEMLQFGSWITYYLGILNGVDPVKIPWVDWFKEQLK